MMLREITIGRDPRCDIPIDNRYQSISHRHAVIYNNYNGELIYKDTSRNGTVINGQLVHNTEVRIKPGMTILLPGNCPITWERIYSFFPAQSIRNVPNGTQFTSAAGGGTNYGGGGGMPPIQPGQQQGGYPQSNAIQDEQEDPIFLEKWNWGGFFLTPAWVLANGYWWILFFIWFPLIPSIIVGIYANRWGWKKSTDRNFARYRIRQETWSHAGLFCFFAMLVTIGIGMALSLIFFLLLMPLIFI